MCDSNHCDHNHDPEKRSIASDYMLHELIAKRAREQGKKRQQIRHAITAMALAQRIHMRNSVEKRLKASVEGAAFEALQNAARIAHSHGGYIRKAS